LSYVTRPFGKYFSDIRFSAMISFSFLNRRKPVFGSKRNSEKEHEAASREKTSKYFHWNFLRAVAVPRFFLFFGSRFARLDGEKKIFNEFRCLSFLLDSLRCLQANLCVYSWRGAQFS
jgi:hypothetical protein